METVKYNVLDGSMKYQKEMMKKFSDTLTEKEKERAMSDEFAYLDDED